MLNRVKGLVVVALVPVFALAVGCGGNTSAPSGSTSTESAQTTQPAAGPTAHGPLKLALSDASLSAAQRSAIADLATQAEARHAASRVARQDLAEAIATQVETGTFDRAALQPKVDAVAAAHEEHGSLEALHAILDSTQRATFASAMQAKMAEPKAKHHDHHDAMRAWADELGLSAAQKLEIKNAMRAKFADRHHSLSDAVSRAKDHGKGQMLEAFKSDRFVMADVTAARPKTDKSERMLGLIEAAMPILTAEQRTMAAQMIRAQHAAKHDEL